MHTISQIAGPQPGDVFWANIVNGCENRHATGKERPVVVVATTSEGHLLVVGLTSKRTRCGGQPRLEVCHGSDWKLRGRSYVFSQHISRVSRHDVFEFIGRLSDEGIATVTELCRLDRRWVA